MLPCLARERPEPPRPPSTDTRENGFTIEATVMADATPASTYRDLTRVNLWWDPAHTWSGSARNLKLEPKAGGCFCEKLADGGSVQHGRVIFAQPGKDAPAPGGARAPSGHGRGGRAELHLAPDGPGTRITMTYRVAGVFTMDSAKLAPLVDQVMGTQLGRLRNFRKRAPGWALMAGPPYIYECRCRAGQGEAGGATKIHSKIRANCR